MVPRWGMTVLAMLAVVGSAASGKAAETLTCKAPDALIDDVREVAGHLDTVILRVASRMPPGSRLGTVNASPATGPAGALDLVADASELLKALNNSLNRQSVEAMSSKDRALAATGDMKIATMLHLDLQRAMRLLGTPAAQNYANDLDMEMFQLVEAIARYTACSIRDI